MFDDNLNFLKKQSELLKQWVDKDVDDESYDEIMNELGVDIKSLEKGMLSTKKQLPLGVKLIHPDAVMPKYHYESDSGFDLFSVEDVEIPAFGRALVPSGICLDIKDGYEIQVRTKSGMALNQGLMVLNSPGTIDGGFSGEIKGILFNTNNHPVTIKKGTKFAQAVLCPVVNGGWVHLEKVDSIENKERGDNGFGSTGLK